MSDELSGKKVAFLATDGVERVELEQPRQAVIDAGGDVTLVTIDELTIKVFENDEGPKSSTQGDQLVGDVDAADFDALVLPGGVANPDKLRQDDDAVALAKAFVDQGKPVAAICHGPWLLAEAGVVEGRKLTSFPSLETDLRNAGAHWVDEEVVIDRGIITSRDPDDLDAFSKAVVEQIAAAAPAAR